MNQKQIKFLVTIFVLAMAIALFYRNSNASGLKADEAEKIAQSYVPSEFTYVSTEDDGDKYEIKFKNDETGGKLEVEVNKETEAVVSADYSALSEMGGSKQVLTEADAEARAREIFDTVKAVKAAAETDDGMYFYKVQVTTGEFYAEIELNAETGDIIEVEAEYSAKTE